jgi:hypothetical protein
MCGVWVLGVGGPWLAAVYMRVGGAWWGIGSFDETGVYKNISIAAE